MPELPQLDGVDSLGFDTETTVERDHKLVGVSFRLPDGRKQYVPIRHPGGGNYPEEYVRNWMKTEFRGKRLVVANAKFEIDTALGFGVDFEEMGVSFRDIFNAAALLNDHRFKLNLSLLAQEEFPGYERIEAKHQHLYLMTAAEAAPVAIEDANLAWLINESYIPKIAAEGLEKVQDLEDDLVYATAAMQRNGAYLDVPKLIRWRNEVAAEYNKRVVRIHELTGLRVNPTSPQDMAKLLTTPGDRRYWGEDG